jgi:hypothetical protein
MTPDEEMLKYLILGALRGMIHLPNFPVLVKTTGASYDERGIIRYFTITTASGLKFKVMVEPEEE